MQASLSKLNPRLEQMVGECIRIPRRLEEWNIFGTAPRRAILNNFGAAGSNAALLLEEYSKPQPEKSRRTRSVYPFMISARTVEAFDELLHQYKSFIGAHCAHMGIQDVCYTATARRPVCQQRLLLACSSIEDLVEQLNSVSLEPAICLCPRSPVVFVFSGQGSLYLGMGKELMETSEDFRQVIKDCDNMIQNLGFRSIIELLEKTDLSEVFLRGDDLMIAFQCACVVVEIGIAKLWMSWGVQPDYLIGHRQAVRILLHLT